MNWNNLLHLLTFCPFRRYILSDNSQKLFYGDAYLDVRVMKTFLCFLALGILLIAGSLSVIEGNPLQPAWLSLEAIDSTCSDHSDCNASFSDGGASQLFYVPNDGQYYLHVVLNCESPSTCYPCFACAVVQARDFQCLQHAGCASPCDVATGCPLQAGVLYSLTVCLRHCNPGSCADCQCIAEAYVSGS